MSEKLIKNLDDYKEKIVSITEKLKAIKELQESLSEAGFTFNDSVSVNHEKWNAYFGL